MTDLEITRKMYTAYRKMENLLGQNQNGSLSADQYQKAIKKPYLWLKEDENDKPGEIQ